ncbi:hypothetical protein [uncultured Clostridium sp.]|uniref:hypothetical protein n=1 Tax=uncultured Clostridium sp. TaxID=59620 RepID=UPI0026F409E3|nr:hypothetical protein [uncultured Clostridium sp.]
MAILLINSLITIALVSGTGYVCHKYKIHRRVYYYGKSLVEEFKKGYNENPNSDLVVKVRETLEGMGHGIGTVTTVVTNTYDNIRLNVSRLIKYFNRKKDFIKAVDNDYKEQTKDIDNWKDVKFFGKHMYNNIEFYIGKNAKGDVILKTKVDNFKELHEPKILQDLFIDDDGNIWINSKREVKANNLDRKLKDFKFEMFDKVLSSYIKEKTKIKENVEVNKDKKDNTGEMEVF